MSAALLARVDARRIAAHHIEYFRRDRTVIYDDVRLLHQAHGAECQQLGITRPCTNQIDFASGLLLSRFTDFFLERLLKIIPSRLILARKNHFGKRTLQHFFPEPPPLLRLRKALLDPLTKTGLKSG